ncbi:hypothetical protein J2X31_002150 [Flavobacterium arsenatis]|uniref:Uncharacterized protein n=1 Tax=Flavobacterium arsenatis TaxID=1484332 RepID=A0ABU1TQ89_9FLAO|nr:DUF2683 family protein [Flavobacterium arsenatis]MDR6968135.1 hypothetical protein [Flavobacterium arsenatis]
MTTITINKRTKEGKLLFEMAKLLSENSKGVVITENDEKEKSPYNPEFVKKVLNSHKNDKRVTIKADKLWESI